jgi:hypothetical protein
MNGAIDIERAVEAATTYIMDHLRGLPADRGRQELFFFDVLTALAAVCCEVERNAIDQERRAFYEPSQN